MAQRRVQLKAFWIESVLQVLSGVAIYLALLLNIVFYRTAIAFQGNDFGKFFYGLHMWRLGASLYAPTSATHLGTGPDGEFVEFLNLNPPHFHALVWPVLRFHLSTAFACWLAINAIAGVVVMACVKRELNVTLDPKRVLPFLAVALGSAATGTVVLTGQFAPLLALLIVGAWAAERRGRDVASGICLGFALSLKPFLAMYPALLVVRGSWKTALVSVGTALVSFAAGVAVFGLDEHAAWLAALREVNWAWSPMNGSLLGLISRALPNDAPHARMIWMAAGIAILAVSAIVGRRSIDHMFAVAGLAALLVSPLGWVYYAWLLIPGLAGVWAARVPRIGLLGLAGLAVPYLFVLGARSHYWASLTIGSVYSWGTLVTWLAVVLGGQETRTSTSRRGVDPI